VVREGREVTGEGYASRGDAAGRLGRAEELPDADVDSDRVDGEKLRGRRGRNSDENDGVQSGGGAWRTGLAVGRLGLEDELLDDERVEGGLRIATVPGQVRTASDGSTTTILVNSWQKKEAKVRCPAS
jgi:hypothetical protein